MCLIIYRPAGEKIPTLALEMAAAQNPDGFGLMYAQDDQLCVMRTLDMDRGVDWVDQVPADVNLAVHFRLATHGGINRRNTHPFKVVPGLYMMHNGILPLHEEENRRSDTCIFAQDILRPHLESNPELWYSPAFQALVEMAAGDYNKLLFMDNTGEVTIANMKAGTWQDGIWLSTPDPGRYGMGKYAGTRKVVISSSGKVSYPTYTYRESDDYDAWWDKKAGTTSTFPLVKSSPSGKIESYSTMVCEGCNCDCAHCSCYTGEECEVCECVLVPEAQATASEDQLSLVLAAADAQQAEDERFYVEATAAVENRELLPSAIDR